MISLNSSGETRMCLFMSEKGYKNQVKNQIYQSKISITHSSQVFLIMFDSKVENF